MSHKIVVGGVASSESHMQRVTDKLSTYYDEDIEGVTLKNAFADPVWLDRHLRGSTVITHSTGFEAVRHTRPEELIGIAPPLPLGKLALWARAGFSNIELLGRHIRRPNEEIALDMIDTAKEFLSYRAEDFKHAVPRIAQSNAFEIAKDTRAAGIPTSIAFMESDRLFQPKQHDMIKARAMGIRALTLSGSHEDFMFWPVDVMKRYDQAVRTLPLVNNAFRDGWNEPFIED